MPKVYPKRPRPTNGQAPREAWTLTALGQVHWTGDAESPRVTRHRAKQQPRPVRNRTAFSVLLCLEVASSLRTAAEFMARLADRLDGRRVR